MQELEYARENLPEAMAKMKETAPPMIKVIISSYAALPKAVDAVNNRADACILYLQNQKNINIAKKGLKKQEEPRIYSQQRVAEYIETRVRELTRK